VAIVTGASRDRGIGAAACRALARSGVDVFFTHWVPYDKNMTWEGEGDFPDRLQSELQSAGVRCEHMTVDLSATDALRLIMDEVEARLGAPSILVNNATHDPFDGPFDEVDAALLDAYYAVNMRGTIMLSIEFAKRFSLNSGGRVINLTSGQGRGPMPGKIPYVATKGAIDAFTVTFAAEVAGRGITVNAIDPGPTDTGWITEDIRGLILSRSPMGRIGQPEDAARLINFLASEEAGWITGQIIRSNGGF
jgi:3-oxoacyl-[acyl-carrier protein] reductase